MIIMPCCGHVQHAAVLGTVSSVLAKQAYLVTGGFSTRAKLAHSPALVSLTALVAAGELGPNAEVHGHIPKFGSCH